MVEILAPLAIISMFLNIRMQGVSQEQDITTPARVEKFFSTIVYDGDINTEGVLKVRNMIDEDDSKIIKELNMRSSGGNYIAAKILVEKLNERGILMKISSEAFCGSSCVPAFLHTVNRSAEGDSIFGFHQGFYFDNEIRNIPYLMLHGEWPKVPVFMDEWVAEISPAFLEFLEACSSKPLRSERAIAMSWASIQAISKRENVLTCDQAMRPKLAPVGKP